MTTGARIQENAPKISQALHPGPHALIFLGCAALWLVMLWTLCPPALRKNLVKGSNLNSPYSYSMRPKTIILICAGAVNALLIYRYFSTLVTEGNRSANGFGALFLILFLALFNAILFVIFFVKKIPLIRAGLVIAFFPIALAFITSLINNVSMFDEGSGSGAYLWLLMGTVPIGLLLVVIGAVVALFKRLKPKGQL